MHRNQQAEKVNAARIALREIKNMKDKIPVYEKPVAVIPVF